MSCRNEKGEEKKKGLGQSNGNGLDVVYIHDEIISKHDGWVLL